MAQPRFDPEHIFGIHEPGGEHLIIQAGRTGWVLFTETVGHNPNDRSGKDYSPFAARGLAVMARLNNGHHPQGTIPFGSEYANFARRCANFVASSQGCRVWIIGNEPNYAVERPGVREETHSKGPEEVEFQEADPSRRGLAERFNAQRPGRNAEESGAGETDGEVITPEMYARCYRLCRDAIRRVPGHEEDRVLIAPVAPWNTDTIYNGNPSGDWIRYFQDILVLLGPSECDGIALHTYTHGADPELIRDNSKLQRFPQHHYHFQAYRDFMQAIPHNMRHLPVYITETDQAAPWEDKNRGWIQAAYREIDGWNRIPGNQKIRALILYRWPQLDRWHIEGKQHLIEDFRQALARDYRWENPVPLPPPGEESDPEIFPEATGPIYRVQWLQGQLPRPLRAGQTVSFPVTVRNMGGKPWPHSGAHPVRLGYRFYQNRQEVILRPDQQIRSALPRTVEPNETITFDARVKMPDMPGNYTLQLDMVHESVTWFADQQSDVLTRWVTVGGEPVTPPNEKPVPAPEPPPPSTEEAEREEVAPLSADPAPAQKAEPPPPSQGAGPAPPTDSPSQEAPSTEPSPGPSQPAPVAGPVQTPTSRPLTPPAVEDVSARLPRGSAPWEQRRLHQVRHLVINHTGAPPAVPVEAIAQAHVNGGYPGIAYDFYIRPDGQILQVSPLEAVVKADAGWSGGGVNICLAGNFDGAAPPPAQLEATTQLCAWMAQRLGLPAESIVGLRELIQTTNPGETFLSGPAWKNELVGRVARLLESAAPPGSAPVSPGGSAGASGAAGAAAIGPLAAQPGPLASKTVPRPPIQDIVTRLPRNPAGFFSRQPQDIQHLVINHTAAPPEVSPEVIANAFREKLPGILYQYFITADGQILQTQPLLQVVDGERPYIANAVNIAFAGDFNDEIPSSAQIQAGGHLLAWLMSELPQLSLASVRGVSEFIPHSSPGEQWLRGRRWKDMLLNAVADRLRDEPYSEADGGSVALQRQLRELQQQNDTLSVQVGQLRRENGRLTREIEELRADPNRWRRVAPPIIQDIAGQLPRHPNLRYEIRRASAITHLAIHHTAMPAHISPERIAAIHVEADPERGKEAWPGMGYHFFVRGDGRIDATQPLENQCYHVAGHNQHSVGIAFAGSFMNGNVPTPPQLRAGARLVAWLLQELNLPMQHVWGHKEFSGNRTVCPGSEWTEGRSWRDMLFEEIVKVQSGGDRRPLYHYMLFGPDTRQVERARPYVERFRPALGFSVEDALHARYVTIVGSTAEVSIQDEDRLRRSGVQVERIEAENGGDAARVLAALAEQETRFQHLVEE